MNIYQNIPLYFSIYTYIQPMFFIFFRFLISIFVLVNSSALVYFSSLISENDIKL
jgi:hypothetical protein